MFSHQINHALEARKQLGLERKIQILKGGNRPEFELDGRRYINFSSNDYMGLASSKELAKAWQQGINEFGVGSAASPLVTGYSVAHAKLEEALCCWMGYERAVFFSSGFSANQAVLFSLLQKQDHLIQDKLNHASLIEGGMLSAAQMKRFKHNDVGHLESLLSSLGETRHLVVTEGVFSMDGDRAPLTQINQAVDKSDGWLMVDDAHGVGVLGKYGAGSCQLAAIKPQILVITFGKAFGLSGAAVLCNHPLADYLIQFARHHVYSTAFPAAQACALSYAANMLQNQPWRRDKLLELQATYDSLLSGVQGYVATDTPIKPFICGTVEQTLQLAESLRQAGFWVTPIRPPTVPKQSSRIRITLTANHTVHQVRALAEHIIQFIECGLQNGGIDSE